MEGFAINVLLVSLNAKFIHSAAALHYIKSYCDGFKIEILESTINNSRDSILSEIYSKNADIVGFSCYIWNISIVLQIVRSLKKIKPETIIILGGPEASYDYESLLSFGADIVVLGEGERTLKELLVIFDEHGCEKALQYLNEIPGIAYTDDLVKVTDKQQSLNLADIVFPYSDIEIFRNRIIYYESSRGCPYSCKYCLSPVSPGVRFVPIEEVFKNLSFFLSKNVPQVKFVDRTFNCDKKRANRIWRFLIENDNGTTNFHFEISAELIDNEAIQILSKARKGLFQFEAGIQSANTETLEKISRKSNLLTLAENVKKIKSLGNIHQHLDLIAGLPGENYGSFSRSFDFAYSLQPDMLQLGFLKLLKGSHLRDEADKFGIVFEDNPPYEILLNNDISYESLVILKAVEEMINVYYNSGRFTYTLRYLISLNESPFLFYEKLAVYWGSKNLDKVSHNKSAIMKIMYDFAATMAGNLNLDFLINLLRFDLFHNENEKTPAEWLLDEPVYNLPAVKQFYHENTDRYFSDYSDISVSIISRMFPIKKFGFDIPEWIKTANIISRDTFILFVYPKNKTKGLTHEKGDYFKLW